MRVATIRRSLLAGSLALAVVAGGLGAAPASAATAAAARPDVSVALIPQADTASLADGVDSYRVVVTNHGDADVKRITVSVPFADGYSPDGVSFSRGGAWVAQLGASSLDLRIEQMRGNGDTVSGTLRFVSPGAAPTNALLGRAAVTWGGDERQTRNVSNLPVSTHGGTIAAAALPNGDPAFSFRAAAFASGEPVSLWYTSGAGVSTALVVEEGVVFPAPPAKGSDDEDKQYGTALSADEQGQLQARLSAAGLAPGTYTLAARGGWSGTVAFATFTVR